MARDAFDGRKSLSCARTHDKVVTLHGPSWSWFDEQHLARTDSYVDGKRQGPTARWFRNGVRRQTGQFSHDEPLGDWREFHPNGARAEEAHYEQGKLHGARRRFFADGKQSLDASYDQGAPAGTWSAFYDADSPRVALTVRFQHGREEEIAGFLPDGSAWPMDHAGTCGKECEAALERIDLDAFPPVLAAPCSAGVTSTAPNQGAADPAGPVMKAARGAWSDGGLDNVNSFVPRGCIDRVKLSCAPDLDGAAGSELLAEIAYRVYEPDCAGARRQGVSASHAIIVLSPPEPVSKAWHARGLLGYEGLDAPGVESGSYVRVDGFVRLPSGRAAIRIHETLDAGDCGGAVNDGIVLFENDDWVRVKTRTITECNQPLVPDFSDPF